MAWSAILDEEEAREGLALRLVEVLEALGLRLQLPTKHFLLNVAIDPRFLLPENGDVRHGVVSCLLLLGDLLTFALEDEHERRHDRPISLEQGDESGDPSLPALNGSNCRSALVFEANNTPGGSKRHRHLGGAMSRE